MQQEMRPLQGTWHFVSLELEGETMPPPAFAASRLVIEGDQFRMTTQGLVYAGTFRVDARHRPRTIELRFTAGPEAGNVSLGIYELEGDAWRICLGLTGRARPERFETSPGSGCALEVLHRQPADVADAGPPRGAAVELPPPGPLPEDLVRWQGHWSMVSGQRDGQKLPQAFVQEAHRHAEGHVITITLGGQLFVQARVSVDASRSPRTMDYLLLQGLHAGERQVGIYLWEGDDLRLCVAEPGRERPTGFAAERGSLETMALWRRQA